MSRFKKEFEYILESPLTYQFQIGEQTTDKLLLKAPSNKHHQYVCSLRQMLMKAFGQLQSTQNQLEKLEKNNSVKNQETQNSDDTINRESILYVLYASSIDIVKYSEIFWDMMCDGLCLVGKEVPLTHSLADSIYYEDKEKIIGEYSANFIFPSWMKEQMKK